MMSILGPIWNANETWLLVAAGTLFGAFPAVYATGLNALEDLYERLHRRGKHLILSGPHTQPLFVMEKAGFLDEIGRDNVCAHIDDSLARARVILGLPPAPPPPDDPLQEEKQNLEMARREISGALERAQQALKPSSSVPGGGTKP